MVDRPPSAARETWTERVAAWRASGQPADVFASGKGFTGAALRYWSSRLRQTASAPSTARFVAVVPRSPALDAGLVIEVGGARIGVERGFDATLLADVVRALAGGSR